MVRTIEQHASGLTMTADELTVHLADGRRVTTPLAFYPTLVGATREQRANWEMIGDGEGFDWPDLDLQLSTRGFVEGLPERVVSLEVRETVKQRAAAMLKQRRARTAGVSRDRNAR